MSVLCDTTLWVSDSGGTTGSERRERLNAVLERPVATDHDRGQCLRRIGGDMNDAGGTKFYTESVYAACFNHLGEHAVLEHLDQLAEAMAADPYLRYVHMIAIVNHESSGRPVLWTNVEPDIIRASTLSAPDVIVDDRMLGIMRDDASNVGALVRVQPKHTTRAQRRP